MLGGRSIGTWLTAFAFGTSYFSSVVFLGYAGLIVVPLVSLVTPKLKEKFIEEIFVCYEIKVVVLKKKSSEE